MSFPRLRRLIAPAICVAVLAAGCGSGSNSSSNGESAKSATQILADVQAAVASAQEVHVFGSVPAAATSPVRLDLRTKRSAGVGSVVLGGNNVQLIRVGNAVYMKAGTTFWQGFAQNPAVVQLLQNRWIKFPASDPRYADLARLLDERQLMQKVLAPKGKVVKQGTREYHGQQVIVLRDTGDTQGGELYVPTTGKPYPVAIISTTQHATVQFDSWDQSFTVSAPANSIDLSKFSG